MNSPGRRVLRLILRGSSASDCRRTKTAFGPCGTKPMTRTRGSVISSHDSVDTLCAIRQYDDCRAAPGGSRAEAQYRPIPFFDRISGIAVPKRDVESACSLGKLVSQRLLWTHEKYGRGFLARQRLGEGHVWKGDTPQFYERGVVGNPGHRELVVGRATSIAGPPARAVRPPPPVEVPGPRDRRLAHNGYAGLRARTERRNRRFPSALSLLLQAIFDVDPGFGRAEGNSRRQALGSWRAAQICDDLAVAGALSRHEGSWTSHLPGAE